MTTEQNLRIIALGGSLRPGSHTRQALTVALQGAAEAGAQTQLLDLSDFDLPLSRGKVTTAAPPDVFRLRDAVKASQGILLGTPEYHGSYSGVLKNALDLMGFEEFEGKIVGLVGVSGGMLGGLQALNDLQVVLRALHAWVLPEFAAIPQAWQQFDSDGRLKNADLDARLQKVGREVARFAYLLHNSERALEFLRQWERAAPNPGGSQTVNAA
jgi:NAD(P)H-dependent FMN reductase